MIMIKPKTAGFTIVELLIVVVVIAILAAITIVGFNGIQQRAGNSAAQTMASQASKKISTFAIDNADAYPADYAALVSLGVANTADTNYQYSVDNSVSPKTFCLTATTKNISYYVYESALTPTPGGCAGHSANGIAAIKNTSLNPGVEANLTDWRGYGSTVISSLRSNTIAHTGSYSLRLATASSVSSYGAQVRTESSVVPGQTYTASAWTNRVSGSSVCYFRFEWWNASNVFISSTQTAISATTNTWLRSSITATAPTNTAYTYISVYYPTTVVGDVIAVDSTMLTGGASNSGYADGSTSGWVWNGTPQNSTSTGLPL